MAFVTNTGKNVTTETRKNPELWDCLIIFKDTGNFSFFVFHTVVRLLCVNIFVFNYSSLTKKEKTKEKWIMVQNLFNVANG